MIKKIIYAAIGVFLGFVVYLFLMSSIPKAEAINVTTQKPEIKISQQVEPPVVSNIEKLKILNENFRPKVDKNGNLLVHPSGFDYVFDLNRMPMGLIDEELKSNIKIIVERAEDGNILPHKSGLPYVYDRKRNPVGLFVDGEVKYEELVTNVEIIVKETILNNSYFVNETDVKQYESDEVVTYGQSNPMYHVVKVEVVKDDDNSVEPPKIVYEDIDTVEIAANESIGYNINEGDLVVIDVSSIENRFSSEGTLPVDSEFFKITSAFGPRRDPFVGDERFHVGLDIAKDGIAGMPVYSVLDGEVEVMSSNSSLGVFVIVSHGNFTTIYAHMEAFARDIKVGDSVKAGDMLGYVGSTGRSTGPHLHFEIDINGVKLNPERFLDKVSR